MMAPVQARIAVLLPCYNEGLAIAGVIRSFQQALPEAQVYVIDNNSTDNTGEIARSAGVPVIVEHHQGKGHAVRRAFAEIDADVYVMADGDGTYDVMRAREMITLLIRDRLDMVVGTRHTDSDNAYRSGHRLGNRLFNLVLRHLFGEKFSDIFSGYRVFSRRFAKSFPALSAGFEIETELSVHAIQMALPTAEVATDYFDRAEGSHSKLKTYRDGARILWAMLKLMKLVRPMMMFSILSAFFVLLSLGLGLPVVYHFLETGLVQRVPTTIAASGLMLLGAISFVTGLILDSITHVYITQKRLVYLMHADRGTGVFPADADAGMVSGQTRPL